jgi:hypothetical protein
MSCENFKNWSELYSFRELDNRRRKVFEKHLRDCPKCRNTVDDIREVWNRIDVLSMESPAEEQNERILLMARLRKPSAPERSGVNRVWILPRRAAVFAFAVLFLALGLTGIRLMSFRKMERRFAAENFWGDSFFYRLDDIDRSISTIQSGEMSMYAFSRQDRWEDEVIPGMGDADLLGMRNELEQLQRSIVGI